MKLGYNTNGLAFHRWDDALNLIAEAGYESVAITLDHYCLNPFSDNLQNEISDFKFLLSKHNLSSVIETGARFLLDPRKKHHPTLISPNQEDRERRIDFLKISVDIASELNSDAVSFWAGQPENSVTENDAWNFLIEGCQEVLNYAEKKNVRLGFEPEPGMLVESMDDYNKLFQQMNSPLFGLTLDIGHLQCVEEPPISDFIHQWKDSIFNIHIEDMKKGIHDHLRFGEGDINFPEVLKAFRDIQYQGGLHVELSRHSHMAPVVLEESMIFLKKTLKEI
jgi:L-ribulose-5-phosphate 3-epimerase